MSKDVNMRSGIRSKQSHERHKKAKDSVRILLKQRGFQFLKVRSDNNRHLIEVIDSRNIKRVLWFKLGWRPSLSGSSAIQLAMLKQAVGEKKPSELSDKEILAKVLGKIRRAADDGVTDMILYSPDRANSKPIAALLLSLDSAKQAFADCLRLDRKLARNGASPTLWLKGSEARSRKLQTIVERYASENLLLKTPTLSTTAQDDAIEDLYPEESIAGTRTAQRRNTEGSHFVRDRVIRSRAITRARGRCELCGKLGFKMPNGARYLETHHILALGNEGPDTEINVISLCADDHRAAHFGVNQSELQELMRQIMKKKLTRKR